MLSQIKKYLSSRAAASLGEIASHCDANPDAVREALNQWIRRGAIRKLDDKEYCKGCSSSCMQDIDMNIFEWIEN